MSQTSRFGMQPGSSGFVPPGQSWMSGANARMPNNQFAVPNTPAAATPGGIRDNNQSGGGRRFGK